MKKTCTVMVAVFAGVLVGCSDTPDSSGGSPIAFVNGTPVTADQVDYMTNKLGLRPEQLAKKPEAKEKIRQTLINSRAMALLAEAEMNDSEKHDLDLAVAAYREEMLVHKYLKKNVTPEPVGIELVEKYYNEHPEEFGGGVEKTFEMLRAPDGLPEDERNALIRRIAEASKARNWKALAEQLGKNVTYRKASARVEVLDEPLKSLVRTTAPNTISPLNTSGGIAVVRVLSEKKLPTRAFEQVSSDIRKKLAPLKLKAAVKMAAEDALTRVDVRLPD